MPAWHRLSLVALVTLVACSSGKSDDDDDGDGGAEDGGAEDGGAEDGGAEDGGSSSDGGAEGDGGADGGSSSDGGTDDGLDWPSGDPGDCDLSGRTFVLDLGNARFVEPAGVGALLASQLESDIALKVTSQTASSADVFLGLSTDGEQDLCTETSALPAADWDDPVLSMGPTDLALSMAGIDIELSSFTFAAAVTDSCEDLRDGVFTAELDARSLAPALGDLLGTEDPSEICAVLTGFGVTCGECASDGQPYCLAVAVDSIDGQGDVLDLQQLSASDVASNPACN